MKKLLSLFVFFLLLALLPSQASARLLLGTETTCTGGDVTVTTTAETAIGTVAAQIPQATTFLVRVRMSGIMTTSANSTTYKLRIRRASVSGTALGDAIAENIKVTAGGVEEWFFEATDERAGSFSALTYVSTLEMAGADATTTVGWNCLTVDILQ